MDHRDTTNHKDNNIITSNSIDISSKQFDIDTSTTIENNSYFNKTNETLFKSLYSSSSLSSFPIAINNNINNINNLSSSTNNNLTITSSTITTPNITVSPLSSSLFPFPPQLSPILQSSSLPTTNQFDLKTSSNQGNLLLDSFRYINGRRYHNMPNILYYLPNDKQEIDRLTLQHIIYRFIWDGNFSSPVDKILRLSSAKKGKARVLDIGCGPGNWLLEMANEYPNTNFIGIDISPIFPNEHDSNKPTNVAFLRFDALGENGLPFPNDTFDFVYQKFMALSVAENRWMKHIEEIIRITKPGGWIEIMDVDPFPYDAGPNLNHITETFVKLISSRGINMKKIFEIPSLFNQKPELIVVHSQERLVPIGSWNGKIGEYMLKNHELFIDTLKPYMLPLLNLSEQESYEMFKSLNDETNKYKPFSKSYRHFTQKQP